MSLVGNIVWLVFGGLLVGLGYIIGGLLLCLTVVGIPFGLQAMRLGRAALSPFGKSLVTTQRPSTLKVLFDVLWILLFGWEIAMTHLTFAFFLAMTIVGLPFAKQHLKLVPMALLPFSQDLR